MMHKFILSVVLFVCVSSNQTETFSGTVVYVVDGDTIDVLYNNSPVRIRLNGIDCPEKGQAFGNVAKQEVTSLAYKKDIKVVSHGRDRYGRTLGDVYLPDGRLLNAELVRQGLAWHYKRYSTDSTLARLEQLAVSHKIGLWADEKPIAPWRFRRPPIAE